MGRWEPNARGRLVQAAMALYGERGYEQVTVAEIAQRAGLTERTFFRHFADKREVLFAGSATVRELLVTAVTDAPAGTPPLDIVGAALAGAGSLFQERRSHSRQRQAIIDANTELRERELIKLASLATALSEALHARGVGEPTASLAAETGVAIFKVAFQRWVTDPGEPDLAGCVQDTFTQLKELNAAG